MLCFFLAAPAEPVGSQTGIVLCAIEEEGPTGFCGGLLGLDVMADGLQLHTDYCRYVRSRMSSHYIFGVSMSTVRFHYIQWYY